MKIIQLSTRLSEGGAAAVAMQLHQAAMHREWPTHFYYGYGRKGLPSAMAKVVPGCTHLSTPLRAWLNRLAFRTLGYDLLPPSARRLAQFSADVAQRDVLHVHGLHTYYFPLPALDTALKQFRGVIILTAHDYWLITGRCASPGSCPRWRSGCGRCPTLRNYPPVWLDRSRRGFVRKREWLSGIAGKLVVVSPAKHVAKDFAEAIPGLKCTVIPNSSAPEFLREHPVVAPGLFRIAAVCADFSDEGKYGHKELARVARIPGVELMMIGKNAQTVGASVGAVATWGEVREKRFLAQLLAACDGFLFLSRKDVFPLSLIEALALGLRPYVVESAAGDEVLAYVRESTFRDLDDLLSALRVARKPSGEERQLRRLLAMQAFGPDTFVNRYFDLYQAAVGQAGI